MHPHSKSTVRGVIVPVQAFVALLIHCRVRERPDAELRRLIAGWSGGGTRMEADPVWNRHNRLS